MNPPSVSIIIPVFNEAAQIERTLLTLATATGSLDCTFHFLVVDDGSHDETWAVLAAFAQAEPRLRAIRLSRNFGKEAALCAGLDLVATDCCIIMDADLQHPPGLIPEMIRLWKTDGYPIVEAVKRSRGTEQVLNQWGSKIFYWVMRQLAGMDLRHASDFKLLDARIVAVWKLMKERETFFRGLTNWVGFKRAELYFDVPIRRGSASRWSNLQRARLALSAVTSFSSLPLQFITVLGVIFLASAFLLGIQTLYNKFSGIAVSGFTTVITLLLIVGSILMISLGLMGTYLARIYDEVKQRPRYIIDKTTAPGA